jgi:hypothetical protein
MELKRERFKKWLAASGIMLMALLLGLISQNSKAQSVTTRITTPVPFAQNGYMGTYMGARPTLPTVYNSNTHPGQIPGYYRHEDVNYYLTPSEYLKLLKYYSADTSKFMSEMDGYGLKNKYMQPTTFSHNPFKHIYPGSGSSPFKSLEKAQDNGNGLVIGDVLLENQYLDTVSFKKVIPSLYANGIKIRFQKATYTQYFYKKGSRIPRKEVWRENYMKVRLDPGSPLLGNLTVGAPDDATMFHCTYKDRYQLSKRSSPRKPYLFDQVLTYDSRKQIDFYSRQHINRCKVDKAGQGDINPIAFLSRLSGCDRGRCAGSGQALQLHNGAGTVNLKPDSLKDLRAVRRNTTRRLVVAETFGGILKRPIYLFIDRDYYSRAGNGFMGITVWMYVPKSSRSQVTSPKSLESELMDLLTNKIGASIKRTPLLKDDMTQFLLLDAYSAGQAQALSDMRDYGFVIQTKQEIDP